MLFLISRIIAKKTAPGGLDDARSPEMPSAVRLVTVDIAAIERHLNFPKTTGARALPSTVAMTTTRWS